MPLPREVSCESMTTEHETEFLVLVNARTMGDSEGMEQGARLPDCFPSSCDERKVWR